jgi:hypothetical protein
LTKTKEENPKTSPPTKAAGVQRTQRRRSQNMARAERAGPRVEATFMVATGPNNHVTGASTMPMAKTDVLERRSMPAGWNRAVE